MNNSAPGFQQHPNYEVHIEPEPAHIRVLVGDTVVADTQNAVAVTETRHRPVLYLPREDLEESLLSATETTTHCPFKGDASYWSVTTSEGTLIDVMWSYLTPFDECLPLQGYVSFYTDRVQLEIDGELQAKVGPGWTQ